MLNVFHLGGEVRPVPLGRIQLCWLGLRSPLHNRKAGPGWTRARCRLDRLSERDFGYQALASAARGVVLEGYFQSWRYFEQVQPQLRAELQLRQAPRGRNAALLQQMANENAICLHVRRGDYAANPATTAYHGLLGPAYYRAAIEELGAAARGATFYVFSDDPAWARANLETGGRTVVVDHNSVDEPWEDVRLMAACRHFVIANSSLSWWGAWLAANADKRVIAPLRWFQGAAHDTKDLCPPTWVRM